MKWALTVDTLKPRCRLGELEVKVIAIILLSQSRLLVIPLRTHMVRGTIRRIPPQENKKQLHHCTSAIRNRTSIPLDITSKHLSTIEKSTIPVRYPPHALRSILVG